MEPLQLDRSGRPVDRHLREAAAAPPCFVIHGVDCVGAETPWGARRDSLPRDEPVRSSLDGKAAVGQDQRRRRDVQETGAERTRLVDQRPSRLLQGAPADCDAAAGKRADTGRHAPGVPVHDRHDVGGDRELPGRNLRECGLPALPLSARAGGDGESSGRFERDGRTLPSLAAGFDVETPSQPHQLAALAAPAPSAAKSAVVGQHQRPRQQCPIVSGVQSRAVRTCARQPLDRDEIALAHRHRVEPHLTRAGVDEPFEEHRRLGPSGAPIDADRGRVRHHRAHVHVEILDGVRSRQDPAGVPGGNHGAERQPSAERKDQIGPQGQNSAARVKGHPAPGHRPAPVRGSNEIFLARGDPAHRSPQHPGREGHRDVLGVDRRLHAERTADVRGDGAHSIRIEPQGASNVVSGPMRCLSPGPHRQTLRLPVPLRERPAALQGPGRDPRMPDGHLGGERRTGECKVRIPVPPMLGRDHVARNSGEESRGFDGRLGVADRLQRIDIHLDPVRRRKRRRLGLGDDGDDWLAHGTKLSPRQDRHVGGLDVSQDGVDAGPKQAVHIAAGVDAGDPRHRSRAVHVQFPDGSPGDGAADEDHREAVAVGQVGDVTPVSGQHSRIFAPGNRRSETAGYSAGNRPFVQRHHRIAACCVHCAAR